MDNLINQIPERVKTWLNARGLSDATLVRHKVGWNGKEIVIPIFDSNGSFLFNKYRRDPESSEGPKYSYDKGATTQLYGIENLSNVTEVVICEGEFDRLILESNDIPAITSTGGAGSFQEEWAALFAGKTVYAVFDNDKAGKQGTIRVSKMIPHARIIPLPPEVGDHGDVTDYFIKLNKTKDDFRILMSVAEPLPLPKETRKPKKPRVPKAIGEGIPAAKQVPLDVFLKFNSQGYAKCPFHNEKTPSLKKYSNNKWWCFGCGTGGDVIDLVRKMYSLSLGDAVKKLTSQNH